MIIDFEVSLCHEEIIKMIRKGWDYFIMIHLEEIINNVSIFKARFFSPIVYIANDYSHTLSSAAMFIRNLYGKSSVSLLIHELVR